MKRKRISFWLLLLVFATSMETLAQCPMCKSNVEQSRRAGSNAARGLNNGILYLLAMPYLIVGGVGAWWYYKQKATKHT